MKTNKIIILVITILLVVAAGMVYCFHDTKEASIVLTEESSALPTKAGKTEVIKTEEIKTSAPPRETIIFVHICGEVMKPGVYQIKDSIRLSELIQLAGGLTKSASGDSVNQAQKLTDGQKIYIPSQKEAKSLKKDWDTNTGAELQETSGNLKQSSLVNINRATAAELMTLPGIGEAKANSIIKYREENQGFQAVEDIKKIEGIKDGVYSKIKDFITVN